MFVSGDPGEPNGPLGLVSQFQASWWIGFLCEHNEEPRGPQKNKNSLPVFGDITALPKKCEKM